MKTRIMILAAMTLMMSACNGGESPTSTSPRPSPSPDFRISCEDSTLTINRSCASSTCTVTSINGFGSEVNLSFPGLPSGIQCDFGNNPMLVPVNGSAKGGLTVSVAPEVQLGTYTFQIVGTNGSITRSFDIELELRGTIPAVETQGGSMTITGCAGYVFGIPNPYDLQQFTTVFVGAWSKTWRGTFCIQTLSEEDGSFSLLVPRRCFRQGQLVYLTAGGLETCVTVPFRSGGHAHVALLGRERGSCE